MEIISVDAIPEAMRNTTQYLEFRDYILANIEGGKTEVKMMIKGVHYTTVKAWVQKFLKETQNNENLKKRVIGGVMVRQKVPYVRIVVKG